MHVKTTRVSGHMLDAEIPGRVIAMYDSSLSRNILTLSDQNRLCPVIKQPSGRGMVILYRLGGVMSSEVRP